MAPTTDTTSTKRAPDATDTASRAAKKRKLRKGTKKSKAERLARRSAASEVSPAALDELRALLDDPQSHTSNEWDTAQNLALRIGSAASKELVVRSVLWTKQAPKAAAHYAKRLQLSEASVLAVLVEPQSSHDDSNDNDRSKQHAATDSCNGAAHLLVAKFLVDVPTAVVSNSERLASFLWPWLLEQAKAKSAVDVHKKDTNNSVANSDERASGAVATVADTGNNTTDAATAADDATRKAAQSHAMQAHAAAIRLLLQPHVRADEVDDLQRLLVTKCIAEGELLHLVPAFASAFATFVTTAIATASGIPQLSFAEPDASAIATEQLRRKHVANRLETLVQLMWPDARVVVFGSSATGLLQIDAATGSCSDDLDLCVLLPSTPSAIREASAALVVELREHLAVYLPPDASVVAIDGARVPIVQFTDPQSQLRCDICVNNVAALWNTQLTKRLLQIGGRDTRLLSHWLKRWRRHKLQVFGRGLSAYGLQLLLFYYLQRCGKLPTLAIDDDIVLQIETPDAVATFDCNTIDSALAAAEVLPPSKSRSEVLCGDDTVANGRTTNVSALLLGFFAFYAIEFDYEHAVVSLRSADVVSKEHKRWTRRTWKSALSLEDPIEATRDLGTLFNRKSLGKFRTAVVHACVLLSAPPSPSSDETTDVEAALLRCMPYDVKAVAEVATTLERRVKLQHFLVLKAFNLRTEAQTVSQQFQFLKRLDGNNQSSRAFLDLDELCTYLSIPPFRRLVLAQVFALAPDATRIDFDAFVRFLQSTAVQAAAEEKALRLQQSASNLPMPPSLRSSRTALYHNDSTQQLVCFQPTLLSSQVRFTRPPPAPGLWKKREVTIQERITEYTKIDDLGRPQHLIEKEKHQTEVLHMETLTGEFAHREITQFETTEQLNDAIVHHEHGREEFVHLKSAHDEVSRFESSIPTAAASQPNECEQPPPSPTIKRDPSSVDGGEYDGDDVGDRSKWRHAPFEPERDGDGDCQVESDDQQQNQRHEAYEMESMQ